MAQGKAPTQDFVSIRDIRGDVVIEKSGQMCMVLLASSINFALKSTDEQEAILMQFQHFLNTIDFSLQIYVQSRKLNIEPYLQVLGQLDKQQDSDLMRIQLREYIEFIRTFTNTVDVMSKNFFVVVPYAPTKINLTASITKMFSTNTAIKNIGGTKGKTFSDEQFEEHRIQLEQRASLVSEGLSRVGVRTITLDKDDLIDFYYHTYNPADTTGSAMPINDSNASPQ